MIYLACPYFSIDPDIRKARVEAASRYAARLLENDQNVFCPLAHGHSIAEWISDNESPYSVWMPFDLSLLNLSEELHILALNGWNHSKGVLIELGFAMAKGKQIDLVRRTPSGDYVAKPFSLGDLDE